MNPSSNRRVSSRKVLRRPATVTLPDGMQRLVRTWDVGLDGMSVVSPKPIPPGTKCTVALELHDGDGWHPLNVPVKIVYCSLMGGEGVKIGMVFGPLDPDIERALWQFTA